MIKKGGYTLAPVTDMQQAFIDNVVAGMSYTAAARKAGFSSPNTEIARLLDNRAVTDRIVHALQGKAVRLEVLVHKGLRVLDKTMNTYLEGHNENCMVFDTELSRADRVCTCGFERVRPSDANAAAKTTLDTAGKHGTTLGEGARKEDKELSKGEAVQKLLGEPTEERDLEADRAAATQPLGGQQDEAGSDDPLDRLADDITVVH